MTRKRERFVECGCCGHWHRQSFTGDCRDDKQRFTTSELEDKYGESLFWDRLAIPLEEEEG